MFNKNQFMTPATHCIDYLHQGQLETFTHDFDTLVGWAERNLPQSEYLISQTENGRMICNQDGPIDDPGTYGVTLKHMSLAGALSKRTVAAGARLLRVAADRYYTVRELPDNGGWDLEVCGWDGQADKGAPVHLVRLQAEGGLSLQKQEAVLSEVSKVLESMMHAHARGTRPISDGSFVPVEVKQLRLTDGRDLVEAPLPSYLRGEREDGQSQGQIL